MTATLRVRTAPTDHVAEHDYGALIRAVQDGRVPVSDA
jgi:hypothetical protein